MSRKELGFEVYLGPSAITGAAVVAVLTLTATNRKTGNIPSLWFFPADEPPMVAAHTGADAAVCGDCELRPARSGGCYVTLLRGPREVWAAWSRGRYAVAGAGDLDLVGRAVAGRRALRIGAWGDPATLPPAWWAELRAALSDWAPDVRPLGYTHQWRVRPDLASWCMASVHTQTQARQALALGWRPFLSALRPPVAEACLPARTFNCPAAHEADARLTCLECRACDGRRGPDDRRAFPWLLVHGNANVVGRARRAVTRMENDDGL